jgi:hypothetical protein
MTGYEQNENSLARSVSPSREGDAMPNRMTPEDGDIVVRRETRDGTVVYVLHTAPGPDQYLLPTCDEGAAQALTLAERYGVRAWLTTDESYDFVLLGRVAMRTIQDVLNRLRAEYTEMPGLRLKAEQVQRLYGAEQTVCQLVLDSLVDEQFLCVSSDGHYALTIDGEIPYPRAAKADLRPEQRFVKAS